VVTAVGLGRRLLNAALSSGQFGEAAAGTATHPTAEIWEARRRSA
jgi:hypothetical protein